MRHEVIVGKEMESPHVITVFEFVNHNTPFIVMQLFNARNLKQEMRERPDYAAVNVTEYIRKCALGLEHLHSKGWLHCDVKPDNYLVDEQGAVKLIDFSIARALKKKPGALGRLFHRKGTVQGTRSYMAPEQIRGKPLGTAADVYGFGCVVHELIAGKPPFTGVNADDLLMKHLRSSPPSLQALNKAVSEQMTALVAKMLSKDADKRPQTLKDFLMEFERVSVYRAGMRPKLNEA